jgi:drug/metabolite transporter (DMT)-like permease
MTADSSLAAPAPATAPAATGRGIDTAWARFGLVALFCLLWSSAFTAAKIGIHDSPPLLLLALRFLLGGALLGGFVLLRRGRAAFRREEIGRHALLGMFNHAVYLGLGYLSMKTISSGLAAVIISTNPILTALLAALLLGERFSLRKAAGLALGVLGTAIILRSRIIGGHDAVIGIATCLVAALALALGTTLFKRLPTRGDAFGGLAIQLLAAGLGLLPVALLLEDAGAIRWTADLAAALLYLAVPVSIGAYALWFALLRRGSATQASSLHFLMPPLGLLLGWLALGEPLELVDFLGILPVALGIWLVTRTPQKAA